MAEKFQKRGNRPHHDMKKLFPKVTHGERMAEKMSQMIGSWNFIVGQTLIIIVWAALNIFAYTYSWDPYPFIFLNLLLGINAAYAAPIILIAQNRQTLHDRMKLMNDLATTRKAEREIEQVQRKLETLDRKLTAYGNLMKNNLNRKKKA